MYLGDTYNRLINERNLNIYGTKPVPLPKPELYVIYHGERGNKPEEIWLSKEIFGEKGTENVFVDLKAKVIYDSRPGDIIHQYITFARVFDRQVKLCGYTRKAVDETIRICKDQDVLRAFLEEEEVANIMFTLADLEKATAFEKQEIREEARAEGLAEGRAEGRAEGIRAFAALVKDGILSLTEAAKRMGMSESEFEKAVQSAS